MPIWRHINVGAVLAERMDDLADLRRRFTVVNATMTSSPFGRAVSFAGNGYVQKDEVLVSDYPFTMALWCKTTGAIVNVCPFSIVDASVDNVYSQIIVDAQGEAWGVTYNGANFIVAATEHVVNDEEWHHITYVAEGSAVLDHHIYVDDNAVVDGTAGVVTTFGSGIDRWGVGCNCDDVDREAYWTGEVRDVLVYPRALSAAEIAALRTHKTF